MHDVVLNQGRRSHVNASRSHRTGDSVTRLASQEGKAPVPVELSDFCSRAARVELGLIGRGRRSPGRGISVCLHSGNKAASLVSFKST